MPREGAIIFSDLIGKLDIGNPPPRLPILRLFDHLVGEQQERLTNRQAESLGRLEIYDEFKLGR